MLSYKICNNFFLIFLIFNLYFPPTGRFINYFEINNDNTKYTLSINWFCNHTWLQASKNTSWCLLGCCIGDFGTIAFFQFTEISWPVLAIMSLAIVNGIFTSIVLETFILLNRCR